MNCGKEGEGEMIFLNECKAFFRDHMNLFFLVVFPLTMILLLGNMLEDLDYADADVGKIKAEYIIGTDVSETVMIEGFIASMNASGNITFTEAFNADSAKNKVAMKELDAFIEFNSNNVNLFEGENLVKNRTFFAIINGFLQNKKAPQQNVDIKKSFTTKKEFDKNRSMLDYYGVSMIILVVCAGGIGCFTSFGDEIKNKTMRRLIVSPMNRTNIFMQKVFGAMLSSGVEIGVIMIVGTLFFNVHYASNIIDNLLLFLLFFISMMTLSCVGVSLGLFVKGNPLIKFGPILWLMMFFSGTFSKELYIKGVTPYIPMYQLQQAAFELTIFSKKEKILFIILIELIISIIFIVFGVIKFNKMQDER